MEWQALTHWNDPEHDDGKRLAAAIDAADGWRGLLSSGTTVDNEYLEDFEAYVDRTGEDPYEVCFEDGTFFWRYVDDDEPTDTMSAASARWELLKHHMGQHPDVHWPSIYRLVTELDSYRKTGQIYFRDEEEMENRGL